MFFFFFVWVMSPIMIFLIDWSNTLREIVSTDAPKDHIAANAKIPFISTTLNFYSIAAYSSEQFSINLFIFIISLSISLKNVCNRLKEDT